MGYLVEEVEDGAPWRSPVGSAGSPWTYSTTLMPLSSNSALAASAAQANGREGVEVDHGHVAGAAERVDDGLRGGLAEDVWVAWSR